MSRAPSAAGAVCLLASVLAAIPSVDVQQKQPSILAIGSDDIGVLKISACSHGIMGYKTPKVDRVDREAAIFIDAYARQRAYTSPISYTP